MQSKPFIPARPVYITAAGSVAGSKEKRGPLGDLFDFCGDDRFGKETWEKAEAEMQRLALGIVLRKSELIDSEIDLLFAGDLVNQCLSSAFGLLDYRIPHLGLFGACSTCAEGMLLGAMAAGCAVRRAAVVTSSHFCTAERQFRMPVEYGGQRAPTAQWTATGAGAFLLSSGIRDAVRCEGEFVPRITELFPGCTVDRGITDASNMGAAMAPAAADTISRYAAGGGSLSDAAIVTGDLGAEGSGILVDLLRAEGIDIGENHTDCGLMLFDPETEDVHAGASGCGCSALVMAASILSDMRKGTVGDVLFVGTGALTNAMAACQGQSIPGVAHLVRISPVSKQELKEAGGN
ncbi:MAG: stage V sporulation protein AD [Ruminococcaceae bacterium]|nr:stage V sporulation protein AD [Oscillospiraceae bacterium]